MGQSFHSHIAECAISKCCPSDFGLRFPRGAPTLHPVSLVANLGLETLLPCAHRPLSIDPKSVVVVGIDGE